MTIMVCELEIIWFLIHIFGATRFERFTMIYAAHKAEMESDRMISRRRRLLHGIDMPYTNSIIRHGVLELTLTLL